MDRQGSTLRRYRRRHHGLCSKPGFCLRPAGRFRLLRSSSLAALVGAVCALLCTLHIRLPTHLPSTRFCWPRFAWLIATTGLCGLSLLPAPRKVDRSLRLLRLPSEYPDPNHMMCPKRRFPSHLSASGRAPKVPRLRHAVAGSPTHPAEAGSLSYRLLVRLQLLPTPPRGDAVTLSYAWRDYHAAGTCTLLTRRPHERTTAGFQPTLASLRTVSEPERKSDWDGRGPDQTARSSKRRSL